MKISLIKYKKGFPSICIDNISYLSGRLGTGYSYEAYIAENETDFQSAFARFYKYRVLAEFSKDENVAEAEFYEDINEILYFVGAQENDLFQCSKYLSQIFTNFSDNYSDYDLWVHEEGGITDYLVRLDTCIVLITMEP